MQFSVYLFDFDGTLVDSRESLLPVFSAGYSVVGRKVTAEEAERWMHVSLPESFADSGVPAEHYPKVLEAIIAALDLPDSIAMIKVFPEAVSVLERLVKHGKRIGIVSNNAASHIRMVLKQLNIDLPFDCIVGSDMFENGKPSREPIDVALKILGEDHRESVVYVGDSLQDPECGRNAGIGGILVDRKDVHPNYEGIRISNLEDLLDL